MNARTGLVVLILAAACGGAELALPGGSPAPAPFPPAPPGSPPPPPPRVATGATFAGCPIFPAASDWNADISGAPVDAHSGDYLSAMQASSLRLQPDFGLPPYGSLVNLVGAGQPRVPMSFTWAASSDPGPYPIPPNPLMETNSDRHVIVLDQGACKLYETYNTWPAAAGGFHADAGALWDLGSALLRPDSWTSATASGLPILPGLVKYEEAAELGEIRHALAFSAPATGHAWVHPATHSSGTSSAQYAPPMGLRIRLRADFDLSKFSGAARAVLQALRTHGAFLSDNQSGLPFWPIRGMQDTRWNAANLDQLKTVPTSVFEVVQVGQVHPGS